MRVVLIDEIEKADPEIFTKLMQGLEEGKFQNQKGEIVDISRMVIILTSNAGTAFLDALKAIRTIRANPEASEQDHQLAKQLMEENSITEEQLKALETLPEQQARELRNKLFKDHLHRENSVKWKNEVLGRLNVVAFDYLDPATIQKVLGKMIYQFRAAVYDQKKVLSYVSENVWNLILKEYSDSYGARPFLDYIQKNLGSQDISKVRLGDIILYDYDYDKQGFTSRIISRENFDTVAAQEGFLKSTHVIQDGAKPGELAEEGKLTKFNDIGVLPDEVVKKIVSRAIERPK